MGDLEIFSNPLLIPILAALAVLLLGLAFYGWSRKRRIAKEIARVTALREVDPDQELKSLGISGVRAATEPEREQREEPTVVSSQKEEEAIPFSPRASQGNGAATQAIVQDMLAEDDNDAEIGDGASTVRGHRDDIYLEIGDLKTVSHHPGTFLSDDSELWGTDSKADSHAVAFLLESVWASMGAQSVALLRFDEGRSGYAVDALVSDHARRQIGLFPSDGNALHGVADDGQITILNGASLAALGYYQNPESSIGCAAAVAVHWPGTRVLLVADRPKGAPEFAVTKRDLLGDYADMLGRLLVDEEGYTTPLRERFESAQTEVAEVTETNGSNPFRQENLRPRMEIIAEEMASARLHEQPLALALVVPRDTDWISKQGATMVQQKREELLALLSDIEGSSRVEQFGELMAGVFCHSGPAFVERWAERVEERNPNLLIGVALLRARHTDPESFREDATTALHAAYEREEDCVIID